MHPSFLSKRGKAIMYLVITSVLWSSGGLLIKLVDWHPLAIAGVRSIISAAVIWSAFRPVNLSFSRIQLAGAAAYAGTVMLFVSSTKLTTAANAIVLQYTAPIYVAILGALLLKEKPSRIDWIVIFIVLFGMTLFFADDMSVGNFWGNLLGIGSGISLGLFAVAMRKQKDSAPFGSVLIGNILTFILGIPFMLGGSAPNITGWFGLLLLGVFQLGISYVLYSIAIKDVTALEATLITIIEPLLNPIWVFLIMGEMPGTLCFIGGIIIISAIVGRYIISAWLKSKKKVNSKSNAL